MRTSFCPPTMALERDHYDLIFQTFAVRNTAKFMPAVLKPRPGAKADWEIFRDLSLRYRARLSGSGLRGLRSRLKPKALVAEARLRLSPRHTIDILLRSSRNGLSVKALGRSPHGVDLGPLTPGLPHKLRTRNKRIQLVQDIIVAELPALHDVMTTAIVPTGEQLLMIGRRHVRSNNSWMHNAPRLTKGKPRHQLFAHPDDLLARGIDDGSVVAVTSAAGSVHVEVQATDKMMPGVVSLPHGFGHQRPGVELGVATTVAGASANDLTDPQRVDAVSANAILNGVPVTIAAV